MNFILLSDLHLGLAGAIPGLESFPFAVDMAERAVEFARSRQPDQVIITGDFVNAGTPAEVDLANRILSPLGDRVRSIPGNHDVLAASAATLRSTLYGMRVNEIDGDRESVRVFLNTAVEGLPPDQWYGRLTADALRVVDDAIAQRDGRPLLVFMHHPPANTVRTLDHAMMTCIGAERLLDRLSAAGMPAVVFCGHNHCGDVWRNRNVTVIGLPSICFWPHAAIEMRLQDGLLTLSEHRLIVRVEDSPHEKARSNESFRRWAESTVPSLAIRVGCV